MLTKRRSGLIFAVTLTLFIIIFTTIKASGTPTAFIDVNPKEYVNTVADVTFNVVQEGDGGFQYVEFPDGSKSMAKDNVFMIPDNGTHVFTIVDLNDNRYEFDVVVNNVDKQAPSIVVSNLTNGLTYNEVTPNISIIDPGVSGIDTTTLTLNGAPYAQGTPITSSGDYQLEITATDKAGNATYQSINFSINESPKLDVSVIKDQITRNEMGEISITTTDAEDSDIVSVNVKAGTVSGDSSYNAFLDTTTYQLKGTQTVKLDASKLSSSGFVWNETSKQYEQQVYIEIKATDSFGNDAITNKTITVFNNAPTVSPVPDLGLIREKEYTFTFGDYFTDINNDKLTYTTSVTDSTIVAVDEKENYLALKGLRLGETTIKVTANDGNGGSIQTTFQVIVSNQPPTLIQEFDDIEGYLTDNKTINLGGYFKEDDTGDTLSYSITSSSESVAKGTINGEEAKIEFLSPGKTTITITAEDKPGGDKVEGQFEVTVKNELPVLTVNSSTEEVHYPKNSKITLDGTVRNLEEEEITIKATLGGVEKSLKVPSGTGDWKLEWNTTEVSDGKYSSISVEAVDSDLVVSQIATVNITIDKVSPSSPTFKKEKGIGVVNIVANSDEIDGSIEWQFENEGWNVFNSSISATKAGKYSIVAYDKAGNNSSTVFVTVTEDELKIDEVSPPNNDDDTDNPPSSGGTTQPPPNGGGSNSPGGGNNSDETPTGGDTNNNPPNNDSNLDDVEFPTIDDLLDDDGLTDTDDDNEQDYENPFDDILSPDSGGITSPGEKKLTLDERIKLVLSNPEKVTDVKSQWINIYVENIKNSFSDDELIFLQGNLKKMNQLVTVTNVVEDFRQKRTTKSLYNLHQFIDESKFAYEYEDLFKTTSHLETRALSGIVPFQSNSLSLYQPDEDATVSSAISSDLPVTVEKDEKINASFYVNESNRLTNKPVLSIYIKKEKGTAEGYIGTIFEWVKVSEETLSGSNGKTEIELVFNEAGTYIVKSQLAESESIITHEEEIVVKGIEEDTLTDEINETIDNDGAQIDESTNNLSDSNTTQDESGMSKDMIIIISTLSISALSISGLFIYRRFF